MRQRGITSGGNCLSSAFPGVDKNDAGRAELRKLNDQLVAEQSKFGRKTIPPLTIRA